MAQDRDTVIIEKRFLRSHLKQIRDSLSDDYRKHASIQICRNIIQGIFSRLRGVHVLGAYYPIYSEVDVSLLFSYWWGLGYSISLPTMRGGDIEFRVWDGKQTLVTHDWGILEPDPEKAQLVLPQVILVPLLGFDDRGHRIGYGYGCYDKFLGGVDGVCAIGCAFAAQEVGKIPVLEHDFTLDWIVTEKGVLLSPALQV